MQPSILAVVNMINIKLCHQSVNSDGGQGALDQILDTLEVTSTLIWTSLVVGFHTRAQDLLLFVIFLGQGSSGIGEKTT